MSNKTRNFLISLILILFAIVYIFLVVKVDVQSIGVNNTKVGFASINQAFFFATGVNMVWYHLTDWLGVVPILMSFIYAVVGLVQSIKRKGIFKVDKEILLLGAFYIILILLYLFFESVIINYRPILMDGFLEASFPSSHTLMAVCICGSSIIVNNRLLKNKLTNILNIISLIIIAVTIIGRLISGVHWLTDIIGGIIISSALLMTFYSILQLINNKSNKNS